MLFFIRKMDKNERKETHLVNTHSKIKAKT